MNYLKINKEFLKKDRVDLYEVIKEYEKNNRYARNIEWDEDFAEIRVRQGKKYIYLHSIHNATREVKELMKNKPKQIEQLCLFGLPTKGQIEDVLKNFTLLKRIFIVVPSIGIFYKWLQYNSLEELYELIEKYAIDRGECVLLVADKFIQIAAVLKGVSSVGQHEKLIILPFISYLTLFTEFFLEICQVMKIALYDKNIMRDTRRLWRNTWLLTNWTILAAQTANALQLSHIFREYPCVVVGAGASLEKNIQLLKDVYDRAIIIAAGTAISILNKNNIKPHIYIGVDAGDLTNRIYRGVKRDIPILCSHSFYAPIVQEYAGEVFTFAIGAMDQLAVSMYKEIEEILVTTGGLSVTNIAHALAVQLGCKKIIFMGQDCCYTKNKLYAQGSWADGSKYAKRYSENEEEILTVDIYGQEVITSNVLLSLNRTITNYVNNNKNCKFFNATEGGLNIVGAKNITLQEVIDKELKKTGNIAALIKDAASSYKMQDVSRKTTLKKKFASNYKQQMLELEKVLIKQKSLLLEVDVLVANNYDKLQKSMALFSQLGKYELYTKTMQENFIFDINEVLMLDTGKYTYELLEGLKTVNKRLLEHVQAAIVLAEEFLEERAPLNRVIYVR